jgi:hypothetical protein
VIGFIVFMVLVLDLLWLLSRHLGSENSFERKMGFAFTAIFIVDLMEGVSNMPLFENDLVFVGFMLGFYFFYYTTFRKATSVEVSGR